MLIDHRTYTLRPGTMAKSLALYEEYGMKAQKRHLGEPLAYLVTESGELNTYVHIWVYKDAADRAACAAGRAAVDRCRAVADRRRAAADRCRTARRESRQ